jgi:membrane fusion protein (multidrug efflux system)
MTAMDESSKGEQGLDVPRPSPVRHWRRRLRLPLMLLGPAIVVVVAAYLYLTGGRFEATDDAYVKTARVDISANVAGRVQELAVRDNQAVHKGDVLFRLDDAPFRIAVEEAGAQLAAARLQIEVLKANYRQRQSELASAQDTLAFQQHELERQQRLLGSGIASQLQVDRVSHARDEAATQVAGAQQQIGAVVASLGGNPNVAPDRHPTVQQAQALLDRAKLNLSYTVVTAPSDGIVTRVEQLQVGSYINASAPVFALVSTGDTWIEANFKEDQLTHMRVGQTASVEVDSYPGRTFEGRVASVSPGTGSQFLVLPPENATGNWVKVVQRLPVRVELEHLDPAFPLHGGLSANVSVDTRHQRHLFGSAEAIPPSASAVIK